MASFQIHIEIAEGIGRAVFEILRVAGKTIGGVRTTRVHHWIARKSYKSPSFRWARDRYGFEFYLSPHFFLDRIVLISGVYDVILHETMNYFLKPGMICFDVGANIGTVTLHMSKLVGPYGRVFAFEPVTPIYQRLIKHIDRNHAGNTVFAYQEALADTDGVTEIAYADTMTENQGMGSLVNKENPITKNRERVKVSKLDSFIEKYDIGSIDLIKVDIQGCEPLFINGAAKAIARFRPIILMEIQPEDLRYINVTSIDLFTKMESFCYKAYQILYPLKFLRISPETIDSDYYSSNVLFSVNDL